MLYSSYYHTTTDEKILEAFNAVKTKIMAVYNSHWMQECIEGESCKDLKVLRYWSALTYCILIYKRVQDGLITNDDELEEQMNYAQNKKNFRSCGIDIRPIMDILYTPNPTNNPVDIGDILSTPAESNPGNPACDEWADVEW